ncbi:IclR family transcriptional regulator [Pseudomaricurvus alkylphenolicus]|uniref:IclR family transcriptional regulator n=1 Tax=Pseudomaricurvus alkylphenolicus TaxID=1306991 RepID=UPI0014216F24|nr:IclR family transcriptional regulator [Pseudomaricurvus alkylphenolicus]NIB42370.1 IclR family transcriptional regulator [Pseudomaricurvus alkylphenolicus]
MTGTKSIDKALSVLKHVLWDEETRVEELAQQLDMPLATIYRHITALERGGLVWRENRNAFAPGVCLLRRFDTQGFNAFLSEQSRPIVEAFSKHMNLTVHLGVFEDDMVTYLVKCAVEGSGFFTRETAQLDAYCSGLGKVLLGSLSARELDNYFSSGTLPKITAATITDEAQLRKEVRAVAKRGYGMDVEEFEEGLFCVAVPITDRDQKVLAALSVSSREPEHVGANLKSVLKKLRTAAGDIQEALYSGTG